jgi:integrase
MQEERIVEPSTDLVIVSQAPSGEMTVAELVAKASHYVESAKAPETVRGYRIDWKDFSGWCERHGRDAMPASSETVALYLTEEAGHHKPATLQRRLSSIAQAHSAAGYNDSPTKSALVCSVWQGIRREKGVAKQGKSPALVNDMVRMVGHLGSERTIDVRDKALLLIGFAGALRRSEVVSLEVRDIAFGEQGVTLLLRRSKTDQEGLGQKIAIPFGHQEETCPVKALEAWIQKGSILEGFLFRAVDRHGNVAAAKMDGKSVARIVKRAMLRTGKDPALFAGHSLRAGLATSAAMAGKSMNAIMKQTRHRSEAMVRVYIREGSLFRDNAAEGIGL